MRRELCGDGWPHAHRDRDGALGLGKGGATGAGTGAAAFRAGSHRRDTVKLILWPVVSLRPVERPINAENSPTVLS